MEARSVRVRVSVMNNKNNKRKNDEEKEEDGDYLEEEDVKKVGSHIVGQVFVVFCSFLQTIQPSCGAV